MRNRRNSTVFTKAILQRPLCAALLLAMTPAALAQPFLSTPGARERALGGATGAMTGSPSAFWHNPALLTDAPSSFVAGLQQIPKRDVEELETHRSDYMAGAAFVNANKWIGTVATGLFFHRPHSLRYRIADSGQPDSAHGRVHVTTRALSVPYAIAFADSGLSLGGTAEILRVDASNSRIHFRGGDGVVREYDGADSSHIGGSATLGLRYNLRQSVRQRLRLGAVWRLPTTSSARIEAEPRPVSRALADRGSGYQLSLASKHRMASGDSVELGLQHAYNDWRRGGNTRRQSAGLEYRRHFGETLLQSGELAWRVGMARFESRAAADWQDWPDGRLLSAGVGVAFSGGWTLDFAAERSRESRAAGVQRETFLGADVGYRY